MPDLGAISLLPSALPVFFSLQWGGPSQEAHRSLLFVCLCSRLDWGGWGGCWGPVVGPAEYRGDGLVPQGADLAHFWQSLLGNATGQGSHVRGKISSRLTFLRL